MKINKISMLGDLVSEAINIMPMVKSADAFSKMLKEAGFEKISANGLARILSVIIAKVQGLTPEMEIKLLETIKNTLANQAKNVPDWSIGEADFKLLWPRLVKDLRKQKIAVPDFNQDSGILDLFNQAVDDLTKPGAPGRELLQKFRSRKNLDKQYNELREIQQNPSIPAQNPPAQTRLLPVGNPVQRV
jgi:hypothetical protein